MKIFSSYKVPYTYKYFGIMIIVLDISLIEKFIGFQKIPLVPW